MEQKISAKGITDNGSISKIQKQLRKLNSKKKKKKKNSTFKNGQKTLIDIFPKKTYEKPTGT